MTKEIAAKKRPKGGTKGRFPIACSSELEKPWDAIFTHPSLKGESVTRDRRFKAIFIVRGSSLSSGRAMALISHVPPESILQGAEASIFSFSRIFLTDL